MKPTRICTRPDCDRPFLARGLCSTHYARQRRGISMEFPIREQGRPLAERFWEKVQKGEGCWEWMGAHHPDGYGHIALNGTGRAVNAHRVSYELNVGPIPEGIQIDHRCRNRGCVNPAHLRLATNAQNLQNTDTRGRKWRGELTKSGGVRGVSVDPGTGKWRARVQRDGREWHVGSFDTIEEAEAAVIAARLQVFTHNEIDRMSA